MRTHAYGLADQALISATSFITLLVSARALSPGAFGAFTLVYTVMLFVNSLQAGLITQPHNVLAVAYRGGRYAEFTAATLCTQGVFLIPVIAIGAVGAGLAAALDSHWASLVLAMLPAIVAWQLQEATRRILYTEARIGSALLSDSVAYGGQALLTLVLWHATRLTAPTIVYVIGATSFAGFLIGYAKIRKSIRWTVRRADLIRHWQFGRWLAAAAIGFGVSAYFYFYGVAFLLGAAASGELKASQLVLGPLNVLLIFLSTVLPIRLSKALAGSGEDGLHRSFMRSVVATAPIVVVSCVGAAIFATPLLRWLYGDRYAHAEDLVALFAMYYVLSYIAQMATSLLSARRRSRPIFVANVAGAAMSVTLGWFFISLGGVEGAVLGMSVGMVLVVVTLAAYLRRGSGRSTRDEMPKVGPHPLDKALAAERARALD